jgi:hypothetical protein
MKLLEQTTLCSNVLWRNYAFGKWPIVVFGKKSNKVTTTIMIVWGLSTRPKTLPERTTKTTHYVSLGSTHSSGTKNHPFFHCLIITTLYNIIGTLQYFTIAIGANISFDGTTRNVTPQIFETCLTLGQHRTHIKKTFHSKLFIKRLPKSCRIQNSN